MSVKLAAAQDEDMFTSSLPTEQQRDLAKRLTEFLSQYSRLSNSYIIVRIDDLLLQFPAFPASYVKGVNSCCVLEQIYYFKSLHSQQNNSN